MEGQPYYQVYGLEDWILHVEEWTGLPYLGDDAQFSTNENVLSDVQNDIHPESSSTFTVKEDPGLDKSRESPPSTVPSKSRFVIARSPPRTESGTGNTVSSDLNVTSYIEPPPGSRNNQPPQPNCSRKRAASTTDTKVQCKRQKLSSSKRGKKHDLTPIETYVNRAVEKNNFEETGMIKMYGLAAYDEDKHFAWIQKIKPKEFSIKQPSYFEKFDKSRVSNRVNQQQKSGIMAIKFLKLDKNRCSEYPSKVKKHMEEIERSFSHSSSRLRFITHREWNELDEECFYYVKH
jgi:hypothetical protein